MSFPSALRTSNSGEWRTPRELFDELEAEFHFTLDVASTDENALVENHYTKEDDELNQPWSGAVWCNPPYGREIGAWVEKAATTNEGGQTSCLSQRARILLTGTSGFLAKQRQSGFCADGCILAVVVQRRFLAQLLYTTSARDDISR